MYEWNIPKVISTIAIESLSGTRAFGDFAIVGKTLVHFGINVSRLRGNVHGKPQRLISATKGFWLFSIFKPVGAIFHFSPLYHLPARPTLPPLQKFVLFCARSNFISFTPGFPRAAGRLIRTYYSLGRGRQNCF